MSLLEIKNVKKNFGGVEVLKDISLKVDKGEVLGIIGPSGSGKSTLLRCATGLETPDDGEINYDGTFGLVFQNFNLFPHYSVMKNITDAPLRVQKRKKEEVYKEARELLAKMGLSDKENAYPYQLSGGQQQRAAAFGEEVALLVDGVTKLTKIQFSNIEELQAENLRKMLLAMSRDVRVMIIKLCDRLHNMRTGDAWPEQKRRDKARETMDKSTFI